MSKFLLFLAALTAYAQSPIEQGFRQMYNLEFNEAHRTFGDWKQKNPADPLGYVSDAAAYLFAEFDRQNLTPEQRRAAILRKHTAKAT